MQEELDKIFFDTGIEAVMEALFQWELKSNYITPSKLNDNIKLNFFDDEYSINFRLQVNIARSKYKPDPVTMKNLTPLHCALCMENVARQGKENLRVFLFPIDGKNRQFFIQATPFPLFNNHFVLIYLEKVPQKIDFQTLEDLFNFTDMAPTYTNCSNSDLEWTGASILEHMHYQIFGQLHLPVFDAKDIDSMVWNKDNVKISILNYPCGVIKLTGTNRYNIMNHMDKINTCWKNQIPGRQSVNLIVRKIRGNSDIYESYIFPRNSDFRTPDELQMIKSEGVGIIEMAGEAMLPVPDGSEQEQKFKWDMIKNKGLDVIKGIIKGNNPIKDYKIIKDLIKKVIK